MRYWSTPPWASIEPTREVIERDLQAMRRGEYIHLGLERVDDTQLIGQCTLFDFNQPSRRAQIGYAVRHDAWGRGFMHEALYELVNHGFTELALNRLEADIDPRNDASARSLERLGFAREGLLRERWIVDGETSDSLMYGLLARDWRRRASPAGIDAPNGAGE